MPEMEAEWIDRGWMLVSRLERLSADSIWARRASGCRGGLLKFLEEAEEGDREGEIDLDRLKLLMDHGYSLLEKAAREIPDTGEQGAFR